MAKLLQPQEIALEVGLCQPDEVWATLDSGPAAKQAVRPHNWWLKESGKQRQDQFTDRVFADLVTVIVIGLLVESLVFQTLERLTVRRWGMQR